MSTIVTTTALPELNKNFELNSIENIFLFLEKFVDFQRVNSLVDTNTLTKLEAELIRGKQEVLNNIKECDECEECEECDDFYYNDELDALEDKVDELENDLREAEKQLTYYKASCISMRNFILDNHKNDLSKIKKDIYMDAMVINEEQFFESIHNHSNLSEEDNDLVETYAEDIAPEILYHHSIKAIEDKIDQQLNYFEEDCSVIENKESITYEKVNIDFAENLSVETTIGYLHNNLCSPYVTLTKLNGKRVWAIISEPDWPYYRE